jgi:hypothetical protein
MREERLDHGPHAETGGSPVIYRGVVVLLLAAVLSPNSTAGDPWKDKAPSDWNLADTTKILTHSPWVKDARISAPWIKGQPVSLFPMLGGCGGRLDPNEVPPNTDSGPSFQSMIVYRVSWISSQTYREAKARRQVLCGEMEPDDVESTVEQGAAEDYVVYIESPDMTPFDGSDEPTIQKNSALIVKKSGLRITPTSVQLRQAGGSRIFGVIFHFPKATDDGKPVAAPGETELAFSYKFGKIEIKARFQPDKMVRAGASDL